jgi:hypothetical protein
LWATGAREQVADDVGVSLWAQNPNWREKSWWLTEIEAVVDSRNPVVSNLKVTLAHQALSLALHRITLFAGNVTVLTDIGRQTARFVATFIRSAVRTTDPIDGLPRGIHRVPCRLTRENTDEPPCYLAPSIPRGQSVARSTGDRTDVDPCCAGDGRRRGLLA